MLIASVWRERSAVYFSLGLVVGGISVGVALSVVGALLLQWWVPPVMAYCLLLVAIAATILNETGRIKLPLPQNARQVPERIVASGHRMGAFQFGAEMGTGMRTFMTSSQPHLVALVLLLTAGLPEAIAAGLGFGLGRSLVPLAQMAPEGQRPWADKFALRFQTIRTLGLVSLTVCIAVILFVT